MPSAIQRAPRPRPRPPVCGGGRLLPLFALALALSGCHGHNAALRAQVHQRKVPVTPLAQRESGGRDIRCAPYATFGTQALADAAVRALDGRRACLLANHGMIAFASDPERALRLAVEVESLAETYWRALQVGEPAILDDDEMDRVIAAFAVYGQPRDRSPGRP